MHRLTLTTAVSAIILSWAAAPTFAQTSPPATAPAASTPAAPGPGKQAMSACRPDMAALCGNVEQGGGKKIQCLKDNQAKLSPDCKAAIQAVLDKQAGAAPAGKRGAKALDACQADIASNCAGIEQGKGGIIKCLNAKSASLSQPCQVVLADQHAKQEQRKAARASCAGDVTTLCPSVEKGHATMACLREKQASASPGCQQALAALPAHKPGR